MPNAILSNYLWIRKSDVRGTPSRFAPGWEHSIELLKTAEGKIAQQQITFLRDQATADGDDPDEVAKNLSEESRLVIKNWSDMGEWWALCGGDYNKVVALCENLGLEIKDRRVEVPWPEELLGKLKVLLKPRDSQVKVMAEWAKASHGILQAAPAFGKSFVMISSIISRQQRTIVLVHTDALADQFMTRFRHGSPDGEGGYTAITNCLEVEKELGYEVIGRYRGPEALFPVTVATWQSFSSPAGKKALKAISKSFGYLLADEAHVFAAPAPASAVSGFHAKVRQGCSVGPESHVEMRGGVFGSGWYGPIEEAFAMLEGSSVLRNEGPHEILDLPTDVESRGWVEDGFSWKRVKAVVRHPAPSTGRRIRVLGRWLSVTNDHSMYVLTQNGGLEETKAGDIAVGDILPLDTGANWTDEQDIVIDTADHVERGFALVDCLEDKHRPAATALCSNESTGSKSWWNFRNQSPHGHYIPVEAWRLAKDTLPSPTGFFLKTLTLPRELSVSKLAYLFGFYLGNGWCDKGRVCFAVKERDIDTFVKKAMACLSGIVPLTSVGIRKARGASYEVRVCHSSLRDVFSSVLAGTASTKNIPMSWIFKLNEKARRQLLQGLLDSDGCISITKTNSIRCKYGTVSTQLMHGVRLLLRSLNVRAGYTCNPPCNGGVINGRQVVGRLESHILSFSMNQLTGKISEKLGEVTYPGLHSGASAKKVQDLEPCSFEHTKYVYDLEMTGHPSFVANGVLVHNTATPTRKDQLDVALYDVIGPVTAVGQAEQLPITSYLIATGCKYPPRRYPSQAEWARIINWLMKQEDRNDLIIEWLKHDVEVEDRNVLVLSDRVKWCLEMAQILTKEHGIQSRAVIGGMTSKKGLKEREGIIQDMLDRRISIIFATSVFKAGIDIPNLDTLYYVVPQNNREQLQQALGRVRRKYEDKKSPVFRYFVDEGHGLLYGCARGTHKALVEEESEVVTVPQGRKPALVQKQRVFAPEDNSGPRKGLKAVKAKQQAAVTELFTDLKQEAKSKREYEHGLNRSET